MNRKMPLFRPKSSNRYGMSIMPLVIILALSGGLMLPLLMKSKFLAQSTKRTELKEDVSGLRIGLLDAVNCGETLATINLATDCPSTSAPNGQEAGVPVYLRLKGRQAGVGYNLSGTWDAAAGALRIGDWWLRATCSSSEATIVVRAARRNADGSFQLDPVTKSPVDWYGHSRSLVFGAGIPLCSSSFTGSGTACGASEVMTGINNDGSPACTPFSVFAVTGATCPGGQVLGGMDAAGTITCQANTTDCPTGQTRQGGNCIPIVGPIGSNSVGEQLSDRFTRSCSVALGNPLRTPGVSTLDCGANTYLMALGIECTRPDGTRDWGAGERYTGYIHTLKATAANRGEADCYHFPSTGAWGASNEFQGNATAQGLCCQKGLTYSPP